MQGRFRSQGQFFEERCRLRREVDELHRKMYIAKIPFDAVDWFKVQQLSEDPIVLQDWSLAGPLSELSMARKAYGILGRLGAVVPVDAKQTFEGLFCEAPE